MRNLRSGIRGKLIAGFALAVIVQAVITTLVGVRLFYDRMIDEAQNEVRAALNVAREIYSNRLREIKEGTTLPTLIPGA